MHREGGEKLGVGGKKIARRGRNPEMGVFLSLLLLQREAKNQSSPLSQQTHLSASLEHPKNANRKAHGGRRAKEHS